MRWVKTNFISPSHGANLAHTRFPKIYCRKKTSELTREQILSQIRQLRALRRPISRFNIPAIDTLLNDKESTQLKPDLEGDYEDEANQVIQNVINNQNSSSQAILIELSSRYPKAGKTVLLTHLIARTLLPREFQGNRTQGKESIVVLVDGHDRFDLALLWDMMHQALIASIPDATPSDMSNTTNRLITSSLEKAFERLYLLRPTSLESLLNMLATLRIALHSAKQLSQFAVGLIAVHAVTEYYFAHRLQQLSESEPSAMLDTLVALSTSSHPDHSPATTPPEDQHDNVNTEQERNRKNINFNSLVKHLRALSIRFECPVICTTLHPDLFSPIPLRSRVRHRDNLPQTHEAPADRAPTLNPAFPILPPLQITVTQIDTSPRDAGVREGSDVESSALMGEQRFQARVSGRNRGNQRDFKFTLQKKGEVNVTDAIDVNEQAGHDMGPIL
jgi:hypothetical protein